MINILWMRCRFVTCRDFHVVYRNLTTFERFQAAISQDELYPADSAIIDELIRDMARLEIVRVVQKEGGTQLKLIIDYENGGQALFKPMR